MTRETIHNITTADTMNVLHKDYGYINLWSLDAIAQGTWEWRDTPGFNSYEAARWLLWHVTGCLAHDGELSRKDDRRLEYLYRTAFERARNGVDTGLIPSGFLDVAHVPGLEQEVEKVAVVCRDVMVDFPSTAAMNIIATLVPGYAHYQGADIPAFIPFVAESSVGMSGVVVELSGGSGCESSRALSRFASTQFIHCDDVRAWDIGANDVHTINMEK